MRWSGWPFVVVAVTTVYGQMISVYHYPSSALLILGASTSGAIITGLLWGRNKRVWCRFLCPVNGVFGVLAKLAPLHFRVDNAAWNRWNKPRGGMFLWVELPKGINASAILAQAVEQNVAFVPGAPFYCANADLSTLRLSFATADEGKIREGIGRLAKALG